MTSAQQSNPYQSPAAELPVPNVLRSKPVGLLWILIATVLAAGVLAYVTLLAEFFPALPRPQVPMVGLSLFGLSMALICGLAARRRTAARAFITSGGVFVVGWGLFLIWIHLASRSGLSWPDFSILWYFIAASAGGAMCLTWLRSWRLSKLPGLDAVPNSFGNPQ